MVTYAYFWGRKNQWQERIGYEDVILYSMNS